MLNINPWNMVMIVINLLVLYAIFRKFLYKPVMNVIHQREELIQGQFDSAKKTQDDAFAASDVYKRQQQEVQGEIAKLALIAARKIIETGEAHDAEGSK